MSEQISFPGLGLAFEVNRVAFSVAGRPIYWYGILIAVAFLGATLYIMQRVRRFGLDGDRVMDVILGAVLLGIVGARLYYVIFSWKSGGFAEEPLSVFYTWRGGVAIYGGVIGGVIGALLMCKWRKVKALPLLDLMVGGLFLGQAVGRWGNFINTEAFGSNTTAKWGMTSPSIVWYLRQNAAALSQIGVQVDPDMPVHPTFLYESLWCLLGFALLAWMASRRRFDGQLSLVYLIWYGAGRFFIEGLRTDSLLLGSIRVSQLLALLCVVAGALVMISVLSKIKRANDTDFLPLYVNTDEGKAVLAGEFYKKPDAETAVEISEDADETVEESEIETTEEESDDEDNASTDIPEGDSDDK